MKTRKALLVLAVCFISLPLTAQVMKEKRIGIGDRVPGNVQLSNLVNYPQVSATIADFKGKWLILDYWFTGCAPCIESWPKLTRLQDKFKNDIRIVAVNHMQDQKTVERFLSQRSKASKANLTIPSVTGDTILYRLLPPFGYPSVVWIDPDGVYRGSTAGRDLNDTTVQAALVDRNINSLVASASLFNLKRPLFIDGNGGSGQDMLWYSTVSRYNDKVPDGHFLMSADTSGYVIAGTHKPVLDLIMRAYGEGPFSYGLVNEIRLPRTRIEVKVAHPERLRADDPVRVKDNLYTYQLISYEPKTIGQLKQIMRADICKYFNLKMSWKKAKKQCLVLTAADTSLLGDNKFQTPRYAYKNESGYMYLRDVPVQNFLGYLTEYIGSIYSNGDGYPLIDETGFKGGLDVLLEGVTMVNFQEVLRDPTMIDAVLSKYKMSFKLREREIDVLVVEDGGPE